MLIDLEAACGLLREQDYIAILAHHKPDGDTLGSCFALLRALELMGKTARVDSPDGYPPRYSYLYGEYQPPEFEERFVVAVDVAGAPMLGKLRERYGERVDLCIDHHKSNGLYAKRTLLDDSAAACAQIVYRLVLALGVEPDQRIANGVFTGITTDTGCFRYSNVTADTHRIAAEVIGLGAEHGLINKLMYETNSRGRIEVDRLMMDSMEYHHGGRCVLISLPADLEERFGVTEEELEGISSFPRTIEGVLAGITLRAREENGWRVSLRTVDPVDASRICGTFGGGGHRNAAGCSMRGEKDEVSRKLLEAVAKELEQE